MFPKSRFSHLVDDKMAALATDGGRFHPDFRHDDVGAVIANANNAWDGFGRNAAISANNVLGRSLMWKISGEVLLRLLLPVFSPSFLSIVGVSVAHCSAPMI